MCILYNLHRTGHIGIYKQHTVHLRSMALLLSHSVLDQFFRLTNTGWMLVFTFRLRSLSCLFTKFAEVWSLNGRTTRIVSVSLVGNNGRCWSQTFESTKFLMAESMRCLGYFKRENTVFNRSHSSEKCDQEEDKLCARPSIVRSKPCLYRLST